MSLFLSNKYRTGNLRLTLILKLVHVTLFTVEKKSVLHILSVRQSYLSSVQSTCAIMQCHLWPVWIYHIFPHCHTNDTILGGKYIEYEMCFDFLYELCLKYFSF
jgi:hypothetical protein